MTTPTGTPDWAKPLPGGARTLVNQIFNLQAVGGNFVTPWLDVTSFNGLHIETNGFALPASFGALEVQFQDASNTQLLFPKYDAIWRGDMALNVNVPILGAQARIIITGPADNVNASLLVVGHGGGGSSSFRSPLGIIVENNPAALASFATASVKSATVCEGPATLAFTQQGAQPGIALVLAADNAGVNHNIARVAATGNFQGITVGLWIPPQPITLAVTNTGNIADSFSAGLILGRA